jgi:hypothetical protein
MLDHLGDLMLGAKERAGEVDRDGIAPAGLGYAINSMRAYSIDGSELVTSIARKRRRSSRPRMIQPQSSSIRSRTTIPSSRLSPVACHSTSSRRVTVAGLRAYPPPLFAPALQCLGLTPQPLGICCRCGRLHRTRSDLDRSGKFSLPSDSHSNLAESRRWALSSFFSSFFFVPMPNPSLTRGTEHGGRITATARSRAAKS